MIGRQLQQYQIVEKLGEGGMGVVWRARDTRLDRDVALKLLPERIADDLGRERFFREAKSASSLSHPNIVTIYEIDSDAGVDFIAMELIRGETLAQRLRRGALDISAALTLAIQIADALACAHRAGIIHRDLKPGNIMITDDGALKVLDFGLAKLGAASPDTDAAETPTFAPLTVTGLAVGTPDYMSPEQALGDPVDARSDVFAFGIVLYQMLTGKLPFRGSSRSDHLRQLHLSVPTPVVTLRSDVPTALAAVVTKALEKKPEDRYASMTELRDALAHLVKQQPSAIEGRRPSFARWYSRIAAIVAVAASVAWAGWSAYQRLGTTDTSSPSATSGATLAQSPYELTQRAALLLQRQDRPGNVDNAITILEGALRIDQNYAPAHASLADAYRRKNASNPDPQWVRMAQEGARRALELNPDLAVAQTAQGFVDYDAGRFADAEAHWRRAIELEPLNPMPHLGLGMVYGAQKRDDEAERALREAIKLRGGDWRFDSELGTFYIRRARYSEAATAWEAARELAPDNNIIWRNLGAAYFQLGRYDDAAGAFQRALEIVPTAATYTNLGTLRFYQGRYTDAVPAFEKAVELGANRSLYWGNLADAYRWAPGRRSESIPAYNRAIALLREELAKRPADADLRTTLALYLVKSNQTKEAIAIANEFDHERNLTAPVLMRLTVVHELGGNRNRALSALEQAIEAGYSKREMSNEPELTTLRADPRYYKAINK